MEQNKVRTYLLYAIGEILLVVIGILIALQVNNWNENRIALNQEQQTVAALHSEFSDNLKELKFDIARLDTTIHNMEVLMDLTLLDEIPDETNIDSLISLSLTNPTWNPSSYVLNDLKNSGSISRLSNSELQSKLFAWERHFENLNELVDIFKISTYEMIRFLRDESSLRDIDSYAGIGNIQPSKIGFNNKELLENLRFENYVDDKLITAYQLRNEYLESITIIEDLLTTIRI
ncbi:DUF6090 family protein [Rhodohalobacter mucosus]|nr:DUF6090 family protein [Rhodohalobacter mucosus]